MAVIAMPRVAAVSVNHNTSPFMELMLRSLLRTHQQLPIDLTIFDNASDDGTAELEAVAAAAGVPFRPSGYTRTTQHNSHGEILARFVAERPDCTHYLFLDADVCFLAPNTLGTMLEELEAISDAFGIGPRMSWDGLGEIPAEVLASNPDIMHARLHPCCALVKNTPLFRRVVEEIGLSAVEYLWAERKEYLDTFKLMTRVMRTHGLRHGLSSQLIIHFFAVSYPWDAGLTARSRQRCQELLGQLRRGEPLALG